MKLTTCESCEIKKPLQAMRYPGTSSGVAPRVCQECRSANEGMAWCSDHKEWHTADNFNTDSKSGRLKGNCKAYYNRIRAERQTKVCRMCSLAKPLAEFRYGKLEDGLGRPRMVCRECDAVTPDSRWCYACSEFHHRSEFHKDKTRPDGLDSRCKSATRRHNWEQNSKGLKITCAACGSEKQSLEFAGMGKKSHICLQCEESHLGQKWCLGHSQWMPEESFHSRNRRWCAPCKMASTHGVTVEYIMGLNGSTRPECAACGNEEGLCVDHDHSHCPGPRGCKECVRGYLCQGCNMAEGRLGTVDRALALAAYMKKHQVRD